MASQVMKCTCKHPFQDSLYGYGNRVGNTTSSGQLRCTVCKTIGTGTTKTVVAPVVEVKKPAPAPEKKEDAKKKDDKPKKEKIDRSRKMGKK